MDKTDLLKFLKKKVEEELLQLQHQLKEMQEMALGESKSSAGDKYETGVEMLQQEQDKLDQRVLEARRKKGVLDRLSTDRFNVVQTGALVFAGDHYFYLSVPLGKLVYQGMDIYCLSPQAPIVSAMWQKQAGETFVHQGKEIMIHDIQ
jgi:hypothetical protein